MSRKGKIIIISGPSGSGKTTLYKKLLASSIVQKKIVKVVSVTTRPKRREEKEARDYFFVTPKAFLKRKRDGYFLECQKVFGNYYGTPLKSVKKLLGRGKNILLCIDVKGAQVVGTKFPEAVKIFINVPSLLELKKRLTSRASETKDHMQVRLKTARKEMQQARHYDYVILNDWLSRAYHHLKTVVLEELVR